MMLSIDQVDSDLLSSGLERVGAYQRNNIPILCICLTCNRYVSPIIRSIRWGNGGCKYCGRISAARNTKLSLDEVDQTLSDAGLERVGSYRLASVATLCLCLTCNKYVFPKVSKIRGGRGGCYFCHPNGFQPNKPGFFYVVANDQWLKCGITNVPNERLQTHATQGLTQVLHNVHFESGHDAVAVENKWLGYIKTFPKETRPTRADIRYGFTETVRNFGMIRRWIDANLVA